MGSATDPLSSWGYCEKPRRGLPGGSLINPNILARYWGVVLILEGFPDGWVLAEGVLFSLGLHISDDRELSTCPTVCLILIHLSDLYVPGSCCVPVISHRGLALPSYGSDSSWGRDMKTGQCDECSCTGVRSWRSSLRQSFSEGSVTAEP